MIQRIKYVLGDLQQFGPLDPLTDRGRPTVPWLEDLPGLFRRTLPPPSRGLSPAVAREGAPPPPRRRTGRSRATLTALRSSPAEGTVTGPLDGGALTHWGARAPARGPAVAPVRSRVSGASHRSACGDQGIVAQTARRRRALPLGSARAGEGAGDGAITSLCSRSFTRPLLR